jgi:hypothetical protein
MGWRHAGNMWKVGCEGAEVLRGTEVLRCLGAWVPQAGS